MNDFAGKICPYCKTEFKENDDIVVCSACDMPHHKDCWIANQGCTTFGCLGTIKNPDGSPSTVTSTSMNHDDVHREIAQTTFCTRCGSPNSASSSFCSKCGIQLTASQSSAPHYTISERGSNGHPYAYTDQPYQQQSYNSTQQNYFGTEYNQAVVDTDLQYLVGTKLNYYFPKFTKIKFQNKKNTWNWCTFLFAPYWFIYRKMYGYGAAILGIQFVISLINNPFLSILSLIGHIVLGIFGNYIYMQNLEKKSLQMKTMSEPDKIVFIDQKSGTNTTAVVLAIIGYSILSAVINLS